MNDLVLNVLLKLFAFFAFVYLLTKLAGFLLDFSTHKEGE